MSHASYTATPPGTPHPHSAFHLTSYRGNEVSMRAYIQFDVENRELQDEMMCLPVYFCVTPDDWFYEDEVDEDEVDEDQMDADEVTAWHPVHITLPKIQDVVTSKLCGLVLQRVPCYSTFKRVGVFTVNGKHSEIFRTQPESVSPLSELKRAILDDLSSGPDADRT